MQPDARVKKNMWVGKDMHIKWHKIGEDDINLGFENLYWILRAQYAKREPVSHNI